ncbi:SRPBCC domain-containing protein [Streptomyces sp. NPDC001941]|uniref:SRPBCC domain-containing protein n=1 Tax=Streptomyces sp. NPDC001941 TaxID=3154659 RepID=UPI00331854EB
MQTISTTVDIDATPQTVWEVLSDLSGYQDWNPFIREAQGTVAPGERLRLKLFPAAGRPIAMSPKVLVADAGRELRWIGHLLIPGVFDGEHHFRLAPGPSGGTRVEHGERFSGILVPFTGKIIANTEHDFARLNAALKERAESRRPEPTAG